VIVPIYVSPLPVLLLLSPSFFARIHVRKSPKVQASFSVIVYIISTHLCERLRVEQSFPSKAFLDAHPPRADDSQHTSFRVAEFPTISDRAGISIESDKLILDLTARKLPHLHVCHRFSFSFLKPSRNCAMCNSVCLHDSPYFPALPRLLRVIVHPCERRHKLYVA
jgi:hypothetical protein